MRSRWRRSSFILSSISVVPSGSVERARRYVYISAALRVLHSASLRTIFMPFVRVNGVETAHVLQVPAYLAVFISWVSRLHIDLAIKNVLDQIRSGPREALL